MDETERQRGGAELVGDDEAAGIDGRDRDHQAGEAGAGDARRTRHHDHARSGRRNRRDDDGASSKVGCASPASATSS